MLKKVLNYLLVISFIITILVPITGVIIHKMAATFFLLLSIIHVIIYSKKMNLKRYLLLVMIIISFALGVMAFIYPDSLWESTHVIISFFIMMFLAIHMFLCHRKLVSYGNCKRKENC
jgi:hypothetical protein